MLDIARELRRSQQARIAAQKNPDGTGYEPRKVRTGTKRLRGKSGRLKRAAMFAKLRKSRWLAIDQNGNELAVGFAGRVASVARIHQFGEKSAVASGGPEYRYPARTLLGLTTAEREMIRDRLLRHIAS
jgi:phage virion morphogenesis protein